MKNQTKVIDETVPYEHYAAIDLSTKNTDLQYVNLHDPEDFGNYIDQYLKHHNAAVAYGGYLEKRDIYRSSPIFNRDDQPVRDIHLGIDIWALEGTVVLAARDGIVHSFFNNAGTGNYGPTIILRHEEDDNIFFTLYGHLSVNDLDIIRAGAKFKQGDPIGTLGSPAENGGYPPHLHFQIIIDMEDYSGDYPGVSSAEMLDHYLKNCPDPNTILNID